MEKSLNVPYIKQYDKNGSLLNPIKGTLYSSFPNRKERRKTMQKSRFHGESKNVHLTITDSGKYLRVKQFEKDKQGNRKIIENYVLQ